MHAFLKILKCSSIALFGVLVLAIAAILFVWNFPHVILTPTRVHSLVTQNAAEYFSAAPKEIELKLTPLGFTGKHIHLSLDHFCMKEPIEGCFDKVRVDLGFKIVGLTKIEIVQIGPVEILNESILIKENKKPKTDESKTEDSKASIFDHLVIPKGLKIGQITVVMPKITIPSKTSTLTADLKIMGPSSDSLNLEAHATSTDGLKATAMIQTAFIGGKQSPFHATLTAHHTWEIDANLDGDLIWEDFKVNLEGKIGFKNLIPWVKVFELRSLKVQRDENLKIGSDIFMLIEPKLNFAAKDSAMPKASFRTELNGRLDLEHAGGSQKGTASEAYDYKIKLGPLNDHGVHMNAALAGTFPFPKGEEYRYGLRAVFVELGIPGFQVLVQSLKKTSSAIPAPFSSFGGTALFKVGKENEKISNDEIPIDLVTDLVSREQVLQTHSAGKVKFVKNLKNIQIEGNTDLKAIKLTLPNIDPLTPEPGLTVDSRIRSLRVEKLVREKKTAKREKARKETAAQNESSMKIDWKIANSGPIQIFYPLLKPYAPLKLNFQITTNTLGEIQLLPFDIEYLKRSAHVQFFKLSFHQGDPPYDYEGQLVIPKTDYTIMINIRENGGKPKIELTSEPPLEESDIISVLLFNQTTGELNADESNSVGNTQAAIANRALGLFSIWALSSTPIEAVSYNPATHVYAARVKLANGLTASVGTNWENTQEVALRKRLGRNWVLSTVFEQDSDTSQDTTKTLLEWFRRF